MNSGGALRDFGDGAVLHTLNLRTARLYRRRNAISSLGGDGPIVYTELERLAACITD